MLTDISPESHADSGSYKSSAMPSVHKAFQCIGPVEHGITQTTRHIYIVIGCSLHQQGEVETFPRGTQVQTEINFWRVATGNWLNIVIINYAIAIGNPRISCRPAS